MPNELHFFPDRIHIEQLEVSAHIGVSEEERAAAQRLSVSISYWPHHDQRDIGDRIENSVDYQVIAEAARNFISGRALNLIETLADQLAAHLLKTFPVQKVTVEVRKYPLPDAKFVSVTVTRTAAVR